MSTEQVASLVFLLSIVGYLVSRRVSVDTTDSGASCLGTVAWFINKSFIAVGIIAFMVLAGSIVGVHIEVD